ncbi:MAG: 2Fe-2S iron-sulfur cluster-binding protein [Candidatus Aminicenantia bacterium]
MIKITIDEKEIEVEEGITILQVAEKVGIDIPRLCYHPSLEPEGSCRMCLVEIKNLPNLQLACATQIKDGMEIETNNPRVQEARKSVLEFLTVGHPLDCPICDKAGECKLQDYYYCYGLFDDQFVEDKQKKEKLIRLGKNLILDQERCILCTRCVRFLRKITKTEDLGIINRGKNSLVSVYEQELIDNNYSGNLVDICPVGAITDLDFRFKIRTWFLEQKESICPLCSRGCNIKIHFLPDLFRFENKKRVYRITPVSNPEINDYWICDLGRYNYHYIDQDRILSPAKRINNQLKEISWQEAFSQIGKEIRIISRRKREDEVGVLVNLSMTNEEFQMVKEFFQDRLHIKEIRVIKKKEDKGDDFLLTSDRNPNAKGAKKRGFKEKKFNLKNFIDQKEIIFIFGQEVIEYYPIELIKETFSKVKTKVLITHHQGELVSLVDYLLPSTVIPEKEGSLTNFQGKIQKINKALEPLGGSKPESKIITELAEQIRK